MYRDDVAALEALGERAALGDLDALTWLASRAIESMRPISGREGIARVALAALGRALTGRGAALLPSLDARLREMWWWNEHSYSASPYPPSHPRALADVAAAPPEPHLLGLASCHCSGYVREAATRRIAELGATALPWLLVRAIDWVLPVRVIATRAIGTLLVELSPSALIAALPLVERLRGYSRAEMGPLADRFLASTAALPEELLLSTLAEPDARVRSALVASISALDPPRSFIERALADADPRVRLRAAAAVRAIAEPKDDLIAMLRRDASPPLRQLGLELAAARDLVGSVGLWRDACFDPARRIRELAQFELSRADPRIDVAALYRDRIAREPSPPAILGLSELVSRGTHVAAKRARARDAELLVPLLDLRPAIARAVVVAMARLDREGTRDLRLMLVDDGRPGVSKEAALSLLGQIWSTDEPVLREMLGSSHAHVRRNAARLVR